MACYHNNATKTTQSIQSMLQLLYGPTRRMRKEANIVLNRPAVMSAMRPPTNGTVQQTPVV